MENTITRTHAIEMMRKEGAVFSITFVTADSNRNRGGEIVHLSDCQLQGISHVHGNRRVKTKAGKIREFCIFLMTHFNDHRVIPS
ncbi:hypothetical protein V6R21_32280 [Limibacter armeniacum]|uniref:hypothetical protein n=1 Tax=Limibacter armeniacum TaxID=466084 RepID=UPI002FE63804